MVRSPGFNPPIPQRKRNRKKEKRKKRKVLFMFHSNSYNGNTQTQVQYSNQETGWYTDPIQISSVFTGTSVCVRTCMVLNLITAVG